MPNAKEFILSDSTFYMLHASIPKMESFNNHITSTTMKHLGNLVHEMKKFLLICLAAFTLSGCVDVYDDIDTLVYGYTGEGWVISTKSNLDEPELVYYSRYISEANGNKTSAIGWEYIDNMVYFHIKITTEKGIYCTKYDNPDTFYSLCQKHGDTEKSPVGCYGTFTCYAAPLLFFYKDFTALEVTSDEDFDASHPAGSSLLDIIHYATDTPYRVLRNNYQIKFEDDVLSADYQNRAQSVPRFNTYKAGLDVRPEDMTIIGDFLISFDTLPEPAGPRNITVRLTADDGEIYEFETLLTFDKVG